MPEPHTPSHTAYEPRRAPGQIEWRYSSAELWADGAVHAMGLVLVVIGSATLLLAAPAGPNATAAAIYLASLALSFAASAAYNVWPVSGAKWFLRRLDQSAIYLLIAGTYTPFLATMGLWTPLAGVWSVALVGVGLRLWRPAEYDRLAIALYLLLGWSGVLLLDQLIPVFPARTLWLIGAGGVVYSLGVIFHVSRRLRFQNAIWHGFVLVAASIHYVAVWETVVA